MEERSIERILNLGAIPGELLEVDYSCHQAGRLRLASDDSYQNLGIEYDANDDEYDANDDYPILPKIRYVTPQQTEKEPCDKTKEWLIKNDFYPPYSFVEGTGWFVFIQNGVMPTPVELPLELRVHESRLRNEEPSDLIIQDLFN